MLVDASYLTFKIAMAANSKQTIDEMAANGAQFYFDHPRNKRTEVFPWYKANRKELDFKTQVLKREAKDLQEWILTRYETISHMEEGKEGDDLIGDVIRYRPYEIIVAEDKDFLQFPSAKLVTYHGEEWGIERMHKPLQRGSQFLAYQLMYGDRADNIPRLFYSKDIYTGPYVLASEHPLRTAIALLPYRRVVESLTCLLLPSPLFTGLDPIEQAFQV